MNKLEDTTSTLTDDQIRRIQAAIEETRAEEEAFWQEIEDLIDREIAETQILAADIEFLDYRRQTAVLTVWRRAEHGDHVEELRSLVDKDDEGNLRCRIIKSRDESSRQPVPKKLIKDMLIGETGWTVPWAATVDKLGEYWIRPDYDIESELHGTVAMKVTRRNDFFEIEISSDSHWILPASTEEIKFFGMIAAVVRNKTL